MPREFDPRAASKRKHREASEDPQPAKRKKIQPPKHEHNYPSVNDLKRRIRDVKRLLDRVDLPADARIVQERALAGYEKDLDDELVRRNRSQMIKKYHFVRFLDRKAATKDLNRLLRREKEISKSTLDPASKAEKLAALKTEIHAARVNQNYTIYYPLTEKYVALYAEKKTKKKKKAGEDPASETHHGSDSDTGGKLIYTATGKRPPMWRVVEKCMEEGTLDLLRAGKSVAGGEDGDTRAPERRKKSTDDTGRVRSKSGQDKVVRKSSGKSRKTETAEIKQEKKSKRAPAVEGAYWSANENDHDDDESDGGFFEK